MKNDISQPDEKQRLQELKYYDILDTLPETDFDEIVQLASQICKVPISLISFVDYDRQWYKAKIGLTLTQTDRKSAFCAHAILNEGLLEIPDALNDDRFRNNPLVVEEPLFRFYAGIPLQSKNGFKIGTLCVIDTVPRQLSEEEKFALNILAKQVNKLLDLRLRTKEIEKQVEISRQHQQNLEELSDAQNRMISIIAHDVRNPIASLKGIIQLSDFNMISGDELNDLMVMMNKQLDGTLDMLTNLIEWDQAQLFRKDPHFRPVNLYDLVCREYINLEIPAKVKGNTLVNTVPLQLNVLADEYLLRFILRNLVGNANKFTANGAINIGADVTGSNILIQVKDNGVGMSDLIKNKLFKPDQRESNPGTNNEKGSGLGLVLAKEFIEKMGSKLQLQSHDGKGTTVSFLLPAA